MVKIMGGSAILLLVAIGAYFAVKAVNQTTTPISYKETTPTTEITMVSTSPIASTSAVTENMVTITSTGFFPKEITIKLGDSVSWTNNDSVVHTVNSDPHPQHTQFTTLNQISRIAAGEKKSLKFEIAGTFKYHDHLNPQLVGTVIVK